MRRSGLRSEAQDLEIWFYVFWSEVQYNRDWDRVQFLFGLAQRYCHTPSITIGKSIKTNKMKTKGFHPQCYRGNTNSQMPKISWFVVISVNRFSLGYHQVLYNALQKSWPCSQFHFPCFSLVLVALFWLMWYVANGAYKESLVCGEYILSICSRASLQFKRTCFCRSSTSQQRAVQGIFWEKKEILRKRDILRKRARFWAEAQDSRAIVDLKD